MYRPVRVLAHSICLASYTLISESLISETRTDHRRTPVVHFHRVLLIGLGSSYPDSSLW